MHIRLPFDFEYLLAAKSGQLQLSDCGGYNTIYDLKEGIVDIDFNRHLSLINRQRKQKHTIADDLFSINRYNLDENRTLQLFEKVFSYTDTAYFNKEALFCKSAHVSELVLQQETGGTRVVGSCWKNEEQYITMLKEFKAEDASPFVGFRIVMSSTTNSSIHK